MNQYIEATKEEQWRRRRTTKTEEKLLRFRRKVFDEMWPIVDMGDMLPPSYKRGPGRPRKLRRRQPDEPQPPNNAEKLRRQGTKYRCTKCNEFGHNSRGCKSIVIDAEAQKRKRKPRKGDVAACGAQNDASGAGNDAAGAGNDASAGAGCDASTGAQKQAAGAGCDAFTSAQNHVSAGAQCDASPGAQTDAAGAGCDTSAVAQNQASAGAQSEAVGAQNQASAGAQSEVAGAQNVTIRVEKLPITRKRKMDNAPVQTSPKGKKTLGLKKTRFSTRLKRTVLTPTGSGSNPNKPVILEDDEGSNNHVE